MPFPAARMRLAFESVKAVLISDPLLLSNAVKVVSMADGPEEAARVGSEAVKWAPSEAELPYVRLWVQGFNPAREYENQHGVQLMIGVEMFVLGTDEGDLLDLHQAVIEAMFPQDSDRRAAVKAIMETVPGLVNGSFDRVNSAMEIVGAEGHAVRGVGAMKLIMHLST